MRLTRWAVAAVTAGAVTLAGAGVLAASGSTTGGPGGLLADVASHLGIQPSALSNAVMQAEIDRVNAAAGDGKITPAQAQQRISLIQSGKLHVVFDLRGRSHGRALALRGVVRAASGYLGLPAKQIALDLKAGQSLNAIATAVPGKTAAGLQQAILTAVQTRLAAAVSAGKLTATREQEILATVQSKLPQVLARTRTPQSGTSPTAPAASTAGA